MTIRPDPQMAATLERLAATSPAVDYKTMSIDEARRLFDAAAIPWSEGAPEMPARALTIGLPGRSLRARLYTPAAGPLDAVTVYIHGGGWTFGYVDTHDGVMRRLAVSLGTPVLGFDYRLAPEHPFPLPLDDTLAVIAYVEEGGLGAPMPAGRIAVAGDSAGANLALAALIARRDAGQPALAAGGLFYGCYAPDFSTPSHAAFGSGTYHLSSVNMR